MDNKIVKKLSIVGIIGNVLLSAFKLIAGVLGHSQAMISDAVHSISDIVATFVAYIGVRMSNHAPDKEHPYGHERIECIAALILGAILAVTGLGIGYVGISDIVTGAYKTSPIPTLFPIIAAVVSIATKEAMFHYTMHYAKRLNSSAFKADAWHHRSDAFSSIGSFIGAGAAMLGFPIADPIASILISFAILKLTYDILHDAIKRLLDTSCTPEFEEKLHDFIMQDSRVECVDLLHTRLFGNKVYVDIEISVDRNISLIEAHNIAEDVHHNIEKEYPDVKHVMIHVNPGKE